MSTNKFEILIIGDIKQFSEPIPDWTSCPFHPLTAVIECPSTIICSLVGRVRYKTTRRLRKKFLINTITG